jgi:hypothetical protein
MLPSGRQIAVTFTPLSDLLKAADSPFNVHKIMAIKEARDLHPYIDVLFFISEAEAARAHNENFLDTSLPRPPGLVPVESGFRLSDWDALTQDWSDEDKLAMREFLDGRARSLFDTGLEEVFTIQQALLASPGTMAGAFALMWQHGCHPLQEEWTDDLPDSPKWDDYDMLAALAVVANKVAGLPNLLTLHPAAFDRLMGIWPVLADIVGVSRETIGQDVIPHSLAASWRVRALTENTPPDRRDWFHTQLVIECVSLWNKAGETLKSECPVAYGILTLVALSSEGTTNA